MLTEEILRRKRIDVCNYCGWGRVQSDESWECVNPECFGPPPGSQSLPKRPHWKL